MLSDMRILLKISVLKEEIHPLFNISCWENLIYIAKH